LYMPFVFNISLSLSTSVGTFCLFLL
jgi:hypothetical protein